MGLIMVKGFTGAEAFANMVEAFGAQRIDKEKRFLASQSKILDFVRAGSSDGRAGDF